MGQYTGFIHRGSLPLWELPKRAPEFDIKPPLGAPLLILPQGYPLKTFPQGDTFTRQQVFEIRVFPLLGELPKAISRLSLSLTCPFASYTAGNSVPPCGHRL